ncbi:DUF2268 domain-containing protein [Deinococcus pimensis]|uniref:DUF2268 domain-containing protein n=1 Tax=Deinococcus pimensis TaxID=309888 RepID=UPI0004B87120|nr:DUF2268 domain-containing putative Zn-dependent protease [Deinococcus pimensis]
MKIDTVDVLSGLRAALTAPEQERDAQFARLVMEPLRGLWEPSLGRMGPQGAHVKDPVDVARLFRFYRPELGAQRALDALDIIERRGALRACEDAFEQAVRRLDPEAHGLTLPDLRFTFVLADPDGLDPRLDGYTGVGNVPGWSMLLAFPTAFNLPRLGAIVTHELHHNVRFAFEPAFPMTLGQYLVVEGLAEAFAAEAHGDQLLGRWTTTLDVATLRTLRPKFAASLLERDFNVVRGFIFGDWAAAASGYAPQGLPDFAGYAMGYRVVRAALDRTGWSVVDATYRPWAEIVRASGWFDDVDVDAARPHAAR